MVQLLLLRILKPQPPRNRQSRILVKGMSQENQIRAKILANLFVVGYGYLSCSNGAFYIYL